MNIQAEKIALAKLLLETENPKVVQLIREIFRKEESGDFWDDLSSDQKEEIKKATSEIEDGEYSDYDTFMSRHR